jgi:hypothetical protein
MTVVSDTSPINYLVLLELPELLPKLFGRVLIPEAVHRELQSIRAPDPVDGEWATPIENLGDASTTAKERLQIPASQPTAFHVVEQRIDRVWRLDGFALRLVVVDECGQDLKPVTSRRARLGIHPTLDFLERGTVIGLGLDWANLHGKPHTVATSIRSYALCVPTNRMSHIRYG